MTSRDIRLMTLPLIAAGVASALAWSAALLVIRRNMRLQARGQLSKQSPAPGAPDDVTDPEIEHALNQIRIAVAKRRARS
ncbi:hypothetical protein HNR60_000421 [Rhodopseudomonas rhenobacensis]|uniref:Uncharacterized protein n=1 Tax=Rhodopseudomonas rhenobacensis TaxID=87461 RepID=A0A7W7Z0F5_9BRAD|nr:hypothetical protein [Rhodopseudomonas rhenobacensis]MBB5045686.1 hypothetical protein [Rhodopseudomonas rhenobacensis]